MQPILELNQCAYAYPDQEEYIFRGVDLTIAPGECHCITGPTGIGKSTLLQSIQGLLIEGKFQGQIRICGNGSRDKSGLVLQDPDMQVLTKSIGQEVAFGLENLCVAPDQMIPMVQQALSETGLEKELAFETRNLSMGQKYRLIVSSLLVMKPKLLMLDEPSGHLDASGLKKLENIIVRLKESGMGILICEHRPETMASIVDKYWQLKKGEGVQAGAAPFIREEGSAIDPSSYEMPTECKGKFGSPVLSAEGASVGFEGQVVWADVRFQIFPGEIISMYGENGSGKTTLLRCLSGMERPNTGKIVVFGNKPVPGQLRGKIGCLFQNPSKQLFENTVFDEVAFQAKRVRLENIKEKVRETLSICGISNWSDASPHKLSYGQKHLVALASIVVAGPELLLLDDPFSGLDHQTKGKMIALLHRLAKEKGIAIVLTTHHVDREVPADRWFCIRNKQIREEMPWK